MRAVLTKLQAGLGKIARRKSVKPQAGLRIRICIRVKNHSRIHIKSKKQDPAMDTHQSQNSGAWQAQNADREGRGSLKM
jgi:hypothetical protein